MATIASPVLLRITLTYEELSLVLKLINGAPLAGLRPAQAEPLTPEQEVQGLLFAERSLRARELARRTSDDHLVLHAALLSTVAACAYAEHVVVVQHIRTSGEVVELYGSLKEDVVVGHTLPEPGLHQLTVFQDIAALATQALAVCECQSLRPANGDPLMVTAEALRQALELAQQGSLQDTVARLVGMPDEPSASALVEGLNQPHAVSVFLLLRRRTDGTIGRHELTVLHSSEAAWLLSAVPAHDDVRRITPVSTPELFDVLVTELSASLTLTVTP